LLHHHVESPVLAHRHVDHRLDLGLVADVGPVRDRLAAGLRDLPDDFLGRVRAVRVIDHDPGAFARQANAVGASHSRAPPVTMTTLFFRRMLGSLPVHLDGGAKLQPM